MCFHGICICSRVAAILYSHKSSIDDISPKHCHRTIAAAVAQLQPFSKKYYICVREFF